MPDVVLEVVPEVLRLVLWLTFKLGSAVVLVLPVALTVEVVPELLTLVEALPLLVVLVTSNTNGETNAEVLADVVD